LNEILENSFSNVLINLYLVYALISFIFSFFFVLIPLNRLRKDWKLTRKDGKFKELREIFRTSKSYKENSKKVRNYLIFESLVASLPLIVVLFGRLILGDPNIYSSWESKLFLFALLLILLCVINLKESIDFKNSISPWLEKNQRWYHLNKTRNPTFIYSMLSITNLSRSQLKKISEISTGELIESEELDFKPMRLTDMDNKIDTSAVIENLGMIGNRVKDTLSNMYTSGKSLTKDLAISGNRIIEDKIDEKISENIEHYTHVSEERWKGAVFNTFRILTPVFVMYIL
jgi:hypothetical protein